MISRIDHVSIAVKNYEKAFDFFHHVLGAVPGKGGDETDLKFYYRVFSLGDLTRIEIIKPLEEGSFLENFLNNKKEGGVHHITLEVPDIRAFKQTLDDINVPYFGYSEERSDWKELFIHPKDAFGVLIQIAEFDPEVYLDASVKFPKEEKWSVQKNNTGAAVDFAHPGGGKVRIELTRAEIDLLIQDLS
ncbi:VOC family protein [Thermodesulfobacteriota bacterium]